MSVASTSPNPEPMAPESVSDAVMKSDPSAAADANAKGISTNAASKVATKPAGAVAVSAVACMKQEHQCCVVCCICCAWGCVREALRVSHCVTQVQKGKPLPVTQLPQSSSGQQVATSQEPFGVSECAEGDFDAKNHAQRNQVQV